MARRVLSYVSALTMLCALALAGCGPVDDAGGVPSDNGCVEQCNKCPAHQFCAQYCVLKGNCGGPVCTVLCIQGYHDNGNCKCVPDHGVQCGPSVCPAGQV